MKAEPGCRLPWVARLNCSLEKSDPPTMATMRPVRTSMQTRAADGSPGWSRMAAMLSSAAFCSSGRRSSRPEAHRRAPWTSHSEPPAAPAPSRPSRAAPGRRPWPSASLRGADKRLLQLLAGDVALLVHLVESQIPAGHRGFGVTPGRVGGWSLGQPGKERRLVEWSGRPRARRSTSAPPPRSRKRPRRSR